MFKKLALSAICLSCLYASAKPSPFGISIEETNIKDLRNENVGTSTSKPDNIPGYTCLHLKTEKFSLNDNNPKIAKVFANSNDIVEALILEYNTNNTSELIADLVRKYPTTYSRDTFYGSCDVEYKNGNCLIRVVKPFVGNTLLLYGTIKWFNAYDEYHKQGNEIRRMRREYSHTAGVDVADIQKYEKTFYNHCNYIRKNFFNNFWQFDDCDDFFENANQVSAKDKNTKIKSCRTEKMYSKIGDVEEWIYDDNGDVTKIKKTPDGTTVTHGDNAKKAIQTLEENNELLLYGRQIQDANL